jgi:hypothetical protein
MPNVQYELFDILPLRMALTQHALELWVFLPAVILLQRSEHILTWAIPVTLTRLSRRNHAPISRYSFTRLSHFQVRTQTPQTFLAYGDADNVVPIQNSRMFDSACKAFHVTDTLVVDPGKGHGYGMNGIWPEALKNWLKKRGLLEMPVTVEPKQIAMVNRHPNVTIRYSQDRGLEINYGTDQPEAIDLFSPDGRCVARYSGAGIKAINWRSPSRGIYLAKIRTKNRNTYVFRIAFLKHKCK